MPKHLDDFLQYVTYMDSVFGPIVLGPRWLERMPFVGLVAELSGTKEPSPVRIGRLAIAPLTRKVCLGRKSEIIKHPIAFQIFLFIAKAEGALVTSEDIRKKVLRSDSKVRLDTILRNHLPEWVRDLIPGQSGPNGGYALKLPK
jgi:hypothetical protein